MQEAKDAEPAAPAKPPVKKPPPKGVWRVLRIVRRTGVWALGLMLLAVGIAIALINTDWGRNRVRQQLEGVLRDQFVGGAKIGRIEGSLFNTLTMFDIELDGRDGKPMVKIGAITLDAALRPLAGKSVVVNALVVDELDVDIHPQPPAPDKPKPPGDGSGSGSGGLGEPSPWAIELPRVELHHGRIVYTPASGEAIHIDNLEVFATASMPAPDGVTHVAPPISASIWAHGTWRERGPFDVSTTGTYDLAANDVGVPLLAANLAGAAVAGYGLHAHLDPETPSAVGALAAHIPRTLLNSFGLAPDLALPGGGDIDAAIVVAPITALGKVTLMETAVSATAGTANVRGRLFADLARRTARGTLFASDTELATVSRDALHGRIAVVAAVEGDATGVHGVLSVASAITEAPAARLMLAVDATLSKVLVTAGISGADDTRLSALVEVTRGKDDALTLARARITGRTSDPERASDGRVPVHGAAWVDVHARGPLWPVTKLDVALDANATNVAYKALGATSAALHVTAYNVPAATDATIHLDTSGAHSGGSGIASASMDLHATGAPGKTIRVDVSHHAVTTLAGVVFAGSGGRITIGPQAERIDIASFGTGVGTSKITASGTFLPASADFSAQLDVTDLALASLGLAPDLTGNVAASVALSRQRGHWKGGGDVHALGVVAQAGVPELDADLHFDLDGSHLTAHAAASNIAIFATSVDVDLDGPRDLTNVFAWEKLPRSALHRLTLAIDHVDIDAAILAAGGTPDGMRVHGGKVSGQVELTEAGANGELDIAGVQGPSGAIDTKLAFVPGEPAELQTDVTIAAADVGTVSLAARVAPPVHLFSPDEWKALDRGALRSASVTVPDQGFDPKLLARFGMLSPYSGHVALTVTTTAGAASTAVALDLHDLLGGAIAQPLAAHVGATLDGGGVALDVTATAPQTKLVAITAHSSLTVDGILALGKDAVKAAAITGELKIDKLQLPAALAITNRHDIVAGEINGDIAFGGTIGAPTATGTVAATGVTVATGLGGKPLPKLDDLTANVTWTGAAGTLAASAHESDGGALTLDVAGGLADPMATSVDLVMTKLDIAPLAAFAPERLASAAGLFDGDVHMRGLDPSTGKLSGKLQLVKARLPLSASVGTIRQLDATVTINGTQLLVAASGLLGAGSVKLDGTVGLRGSTIRDASLKAHLSKVSLIGAVQPVVDGDATANLVFESSKITGKVKISHASIDVPTASGTKLLPMGEPSDMEFVDAPPPPSKTIHLDAPADPWLVVSVDIAPTAFVYDEIQASLKAEDLKLSYGDEVGLDGTIDMDRGDIDLFGRRYNVELGILTFDGGTDPELSISISHIFPDVTTYTDVNGRASEPVVVLRADPAEYTQSQLLGFLLGGDPSGDPSSQARDEASTVGSSLVSAQLSRRLNKVLPVKFQVRCNPVATSTSSAMCSQGKWINSKVYVGALQHLDPLPDENTIELDLEWYVLQHIVIDASGGDRNDGVDLLWRERW